MENFKLLRVIYLVGTFAVAASFWRPAVTQTNTQTQTVTVAGDVREKAAKTRGYYTVEDMAARLQLSERTIQDRCKRGIIPAYQPEGGRGWRIPLNAAISGNPIQP